MIASLRGRLVHKSPTEVVVDVHGVGYGLSVPLSTYEALGEIGTECTLVTHLHVREDQFQLFGFASEAERDLFRILLTVTGIGPRLAQSILSGISVQDLRSHLVQGNLTALTAVPGIGRKLAERLVVELRDKASRIEAPLATGAAGSDLKVKVRSEALLALTSLGYSRPMAEKGLRAAIQESNDREVGVEELIKASLRLMSR